MASEETESPVVELDDLLVRPGTYFNPQTEVVVVVDDSASIDQEIFNMEVYEGADWVRIADDVPVDTDSLEAAMERFQRQQHPGSRPLVAATERDDEADLGLDEEELDADPDPDADEEAGAEG